MNDRIKILKEKMFAEERFVSIEQAKIITDTYIENEAESIALKRARSLHNALLKMEIAIEPEEIIVGNRTKGVRAGVVFPEAGISWLTKEFELLPTRDQDKFNYKKEDLEYFKEVIVPYWKGKSLEDEIRNSCGNLVDEIASVVKINQKDHAQGHICPNTEKWLKKGICGLIDEAKSHIEGDGEEFYSSVITVLEGAQKFILRYADLAQKMGLTDIENRCKKIALSVPETFSEAVQSLWFLFVILHMESNASSFSPGRMDKYLYTYYKNDVENGSLNNDDALEIIECLWLKFNQIVYLRNSHSASFFAGFPIGFNVAIGGIDENGNNYENELSYLFLKAQDEILMPQPNLSARLHKNSTDKFLDTCSKVIGKGSGMPQIFNDEAVVPALISQGISEKDAKNYAIVGCVELTTHGNNLGYSDAAMFNMVKVLELSLNNGICLLTGKQLCEDSGNICDFNTYEDLESVYEKNLNYFINKMIVCCQEVEKVHIKKLPTAFLSSVIDDCLLKGKDVTNGGAHYNLSGIQAIQVANVADIMAALKKLVFDEKIVDKEMLFNALKNNFDNEEVLRQTLLNDAPKYGNDIAWVDEISNKWVEIFANEVYKHKNYRKGPYHVGLYTVSAHVPMGQNVGATADGRKAKEPLADGGMSAVYGRDMNGPTALLKSVSRIKSIYGSNGTLLNMKFLPQFFKDEEGIKKFSSLLKAIVALNIIHAQFNVVRKEDLIAAQKEPEKYRNLTIRVAGYTAYFTELATDLQNEIIARTSYGGV